MGYEMINWRNAAQIKNVHFVCGYCGKDVAPSQGYAGDDPGRGTVFIYVCAFCSCPTFFDSKNDQTPKPKMGRDVGGISREDVRKLYDESRCCTAVGAYSGAVMICRKILMNLAVEQGAKKDESFVFYVDYLSTNGYVPPKGKGWVDAIRKRGNEANHEIKVMDKKDAELVLHFTEALLRFNYELPSVLEADGKV